MSDARKPRRGLTFPKAPLGKPPPTMTGLQDLQEEEAAPDQPKKEIEASILPESQKASNIVIQKASNTVIRAARTPETQLHSYTPSKGKGTMTAAAVEDELSDCALPTTPEAVLEFLADAAKYKRDAVTFKGSIGLEALAARLLRESYRNKKYKQDIITRGIMLVLYEHYTGTTLVDFPGDDDETDTQL